MRDERRAPILLSSLIPFLRLDQVTHELSGQLGILMGIADIYCLAIDDGQGVTQFVTHVALVTDGVHGTNEISIVPVGIAPHHSVENIESTNGSVLAALEFAAEVR